MFFGQKDQILIMATAHKVGSTWIFNVLQSYFKAVKTTVPYELRKNKNNHEIIELQNDSVLPWLGQLSGSQIFKSHSFPPKENGISEKIKLVTIIRDPRDIMVSSIHYLTHLDPQYGGWESFKKLNFEEKAEDWLIKNDLDFKLLKAWSDFENVYQFKYEELLIHPEQEIKKYLNFLGQKINPSSIVKALYKNSFEVKANRKPGEEDTTSFYRKGVANDWKNCFSESIKKKFKQAHNGQWNDLLIELGYEKNEEW